MRAVFPIIALGLVAACAPQIPDSAAGAGFGGSGATSAAPVVSAIPAPDAVSGEVLAPAPVSTTAPVSRGSTVAAASGPGAAAIPGVDSADDIARETAAALQAAAANSGVAPLQASPSNPAPVILINPGISDENDFTAVSGRETIESDAERLARNKAQYQVIEPTALPTRPGSSQPNIVAFALGTSNRPGERLYSRSGINMAARAERNCRAYASPDLAQAAFLAAGGPERDRKGLDPDGDGFACSWDPSPFRKARS